LTGISLQNLQQGYFYNYIKSTHLSALFVLIGISILIAGSFLAAFLWNVKKGQFDDDYTPSIRILFDDELKKVKPSASSKTVNQTK